MRALNFLFVLIAATSILRGDDWLPPSKDPRKAISIDGSARLLEESPPNKDLSVLAAIGISIPGPPAIPAFPLKRDINVYIRSAAGPEVLAWQLEFVNYPLQLFIAPGGRTVVTMDRWGSVGSDALVFYGDHGRLIKRYERAQGVLIAPNENRWVERSISSFWWNQGAHAQFTADGQYFWIWYPWGRVMMFDVTTGDVIDSEALRLQMGRGRATILKTVELMAESSIPLERIAAARLAGWLNGQAVRAILTKLLLDPYYEDASLQTRAEDKYGRFGDAWVWLSQRRYPVRRAAAEELHIKFGGSANGAVEETIAR